MRNKAKKTRRGKLLRPGPGYRIEHRRSGRGFVATLIDTHVVHGTKIALFVVRSG